MNRPGRGARPAAAVVAGLAAAVLWHLAAERTPTVVLPSPVEVVDHLARDIVSGRWWAAMWRTLAHVLGSVALVVALGVPLGVAMGRSRLVDDLLQVPVILLRTVPTVAVAAIALLALGTGSSSVVAVTTASALPFFSAGVARSARDVDAGLVEMAHAFAAPQGAIVRSIVLPATAPHVLASCRVALGVAWHVAVVAEFLLGSRGVGARIAADLRLLDSTSVFGWGLSIVALTVLAEYGLLRPLERTLRLEGR